MIENYELPKRNTELEEILGKISSSDFPFFLTGSRYFGGEREDSDWDFVATEISIPLLELSGFKKAFSEDGEYKDMFTSFVYRRTDLGIDVQICTPRMFDLKKRACELIKSLGIDVSKKVNAMKRTKIWNCVHILLTNATK